MKHLLAMRRANGDWYALDDKGKFRVPIFQTERDAMIARSQDPGMECFRPVELDDGRFENLTNSDPGQACFVMVQDPLRPLKLGRTIDRDELTILREKLILANSNGGTAK